MRAEFTSARGKTYREALGSLSITRTSYDSANPGGTEAHVEFTSASRKTYGEAQAAGSFSVARNSYDCQPGGSEAHVEFTSTGGKHTEKRKWLAFFRSHVAFTIAAAPRRKRGARGIHKRYLENIQRSAGDCQFFSRT